jgi:hypothetical protein
VGGRPRALRSLHRRQQSLHRKCVHFACRSTQSTSGHQLADHTTARNLAYSADAPRLGQAPDHDAHTARLPGDLSRHPSRGAAAPSVSGRQANAATDTICHNMQNPNLHIQKPTYLDTATRMGKFMTAIHRPLRLLIDQWRATSCTSSQYSVYTET